MLARLWAEKVIKGEKTFVQVPAGLKKAVADVLRTAGRADLIA